MTNINDDNRKTICFSIIMPCFNSSKYVCTAIESIINQTYTNFELILIDDGSTDNTLEILKQYQTSDSRIKTYTKKNGGYSTAINYGLERINGDYFLMMGSDDYLFNTILEKISIITRKINVDMLSFRVKKHWLDLEKNDETDTDTLFNDEVIYQGDFKSFENEHLYEAKFFALRDTGKIYRSSLLGNLRYFGSYGYDADGIFSLLFAHKSNMFVIIPFDGYLWNLHKDSLSGRHLPIETNIDRIANWSHYLKIVNRIPEMHLSTIDYYYSTIGYNIICDIIKNYPAINTLKHYSTIKLYLHRMRIFAIKKHNIKVSRKMMWHSCFPLTFHFMYKLKIYISSLIKNK